ncbi:MAG: ParB/RepB/Spo0J family partition protein [Clostridia bacterium]|nr:ParB/RepB/Spo0J family partition protein [Clostridia bacterium]
MGKGLSAIFSENTLDETNEGNVCMLRISSVEPNRAQPRKTFDEESISELADSVAQNGVLQPILVRPSKDGYYEIIAGERRWRAAKRAALSEIPALVLNIDDKEAAEIALIENIQRENLNAVEEALGYRALIDEYGLTQEQAAKKVGKNRTTVTNAMRLLDLPEKTLELVKNGTLSAGHARALLGLLDKKKIDEAAKTVISKSLSVRATEAFVRSQNAPKKEAKGHVEVNYVADLEKNVSRATGRKVSIKAAGKNKHITIFYKDNDDLDALLEQLCPGLKK